MTPRTARYLTALAATAAGAVAVLLAAEPGGVPGTAELLLLTAAIAIAERTEVRFIWDRTPGHVTLVEVGITAGLLLLPATHVVAATGLGVLLARPTLFRTPAKVVYNSATAILGSAVAGLIVIITPTVGPLVAGRPVLGAALGMLAYGAITLSAFGGLLMRIQGRESAESLRAQLPMHIGATIGTASSGVLLAALWVLQPALVPFALAPIGAVHLALRGSIRASAELAAREAEHARLVRVVDGASDGIVLIDAEGRVQVWNPAMERLTGRSEREAVGNPVDDRWTLLGARPSWPRRERDARLTDADGVVRDVHENHAYTFDDRGRCTGAVVVVRDVSRQQELERLRSDFVARVSHELRSPLTPIRGFATVLLRRGDQLDHEQREEALTRIVDRADHLHRVVEDLLLVTRLEHDDLTELVDTRPVDLEPIARAAVDELAVRGSRRALTLTADPDVPEAMADPDRIRQILAALLENADRYSPSDTPIEVEIRHTGDDVEVLVIDHGPGIPVSQQEAVFERFHRLEDPLTMRTGGVGVGLFIGRRLATAMHGTLRLAPTPPGTGSTFVLSLPATISHRPMHPLSPPSSRIHGEP